MKRSRVSWALAMLTTLAGAAAGQQQPRSGAADTTGRPVPAFELREIVVSAARPVSEAAATVHIIDGDRMSATGARTLDEGLALAPGVGVRTGGEGVPRVEFRGFRPRQLLVLLDGVPLNSTWDGQPDLSRIPTDRVAFVKVTGGTASVLYGEALGGVIEVVTREGAPGLRGGASGEVRSGPSKMGQVELDGGSGRVRFFSSFSGSGADGFPARLDVPGTFARQNSARDWATGFASATLSGARGRLGLVLTGGRGSYGIPPVLVADAADAFASRPVFERVERLTGASAQLSGAWGGPALSLRGWSFLNAQNEMSARYDDSTYAGMTNPAVKGTYRQDARTRLAGVGLQGAWSARFSRLTVGVSGERDAWTVDGIVRDVATPTSGGGGSGAGGGKGGGSGSGTSAQTWSVRALDDSRALGRLGAGAEWELTPSPRVGLSLGAAQHALLRDSAGSDSGTALVAGVRIQAPAGVGLRASAGRKFRFPTIRQLFDADGGNRSLSPERASELELGADRTLGSGADAHLALFRSDVNGYIERPSPGEPFANRGLLRFQGAEAVVDGRPVEPLQLEGSLSFLRTRDLTPGGDGRELQYTPRLRALLDARWRPRAGLRAAVTVQRVVHQVYYSRQAPLRTGRLPDYTLVASRVGWALPGARAEVYVGGENLADAVSYDQYGYPNPARTLYAGAAVRW